MKVKCPGCAKVYDLPRDRIKPEGVQVRCKDCGKVFLVRPKAAAPKEEVDLSPLVSSPPSDPAPSGEDLFGTETGSAAGDTGQDDDLDDFFGDADAPGADPLGAAGEDDLFGDADDLFGAPPGGAPAAAGEASGDDDLFGSDDDLFGAPAGEDTPPATDEESGPRSDQEALDSLFGDGSTGDEEAPAAEAPAAPDFDWDDDPADDEEDDDGAFDEEVPANDFQPALRGEDAERVLRRSVVHEVPQAAASGGRRGLTLLLLLLLLVAGGAALWVLQPPWIQPLLSEFGLASAPTAPTPATQRPRSPVRMLGEATVSRSTNRRGVDLVIVEGLFRNDDSVPHSFARIEVELRDEAGAPVSSTTVYAGNTLSSLQIRTFSPEELVERLQREMGEGLVNFNLQPGSQIPFMALFSPDPRPGEALRAEAWVISSQRGAQN